MVHELATSDMASLNTTLSYVFAHLLPSRHGDIVCNMWVNLKDPTYCSLGSIIYGTDNSIG